MFGAIILPNSPPERETLPTTPPHTRAQAAFLKAAHPRHPLLSDSRRLTPSGTKVSSPPSSCPRATANDPFLVLTGFEVPSCHGRPPRLQPPLGCSPLLQPSRLTFLTAPGHPRRLTRRRLPLGCGGGAEPLFPCCVLSPAGRSPPGEPPAPPAALLVCFPGRPEP